MWRIEMKDSRHGDWRPVTWDGGTLFYYTFKDQKATYFPLEAAIKTTVPFMKKHYAITRMDNLVARFVCKSTGEIIPYEALGA